MKKPDVSAATTAPGFTLTSPDLTAAQPIRDLHVYDSFGCKGNNVSPALTWKNAPQATRSFAVTVHDPDAPTDCGWWHWPVINIPPGTTQLLRGAGDISADNAPSGALQTRTDFGVSGLGGPCPPLGDAPHRYVFTVHALKIDELDLPQDAPGAMVDFNIHGNLIARTSFIAYYGH